MTTVKCRGGKHKVCDNLKDPEITIRCNPVVKVIKKLQCNICCELKETSKLVFIDCSKKGVYPYNKSSNQRYRPSMCIECRNKWNKPCPFCRTHNYTNLFLKKKKTKYRKKKLPWRIRNIMISIKKKRKKRESFRKDRELFKEQIKRRVYTIQYYRYCKHERVMLLNNINILTKEINDLKNKINNFIK
jgi:hypothetical protein